jgi:hypothetical protein
VPEEEWDSWLNDRFQILTDLVEQITRRMIEHEDDRVTILGMIQSAVAHGLHDGGFRDETM